VFTLVLSAFTLLFLSQIAVIIVALHDNKHQTKLVKNENRIH
jgi:hypothetical protein